MQRTPTGPDGGGFYTADQWNNFRNEAYKVARGQKVSHADAQDVAMTAMAQLLELVRAQRPPSEPGGWVKTTAKRRTIDLMRLKDRQAVTGSEDATRLLQSQGGGVDESHEDRIVKQLFASALVEELLSKAKSILTTKQYQALLALYLHDGHESTITEMIKAIVQAAGGAATDAETMRTHWRRAIEKLRVAKMANGAGESDER